MTFTHNVSRSLHYSIRSMYGGFMFIKPTREIANDLYRGLQQEFLWPSERGSLSVEEARLVIKGIVKRQFKKYGVNL